MLRGSHRSTEAHRILNKTSLSTETQYEFQSYSFEDVVINSIKVRVYI